VKRGLSLLSGVAAVSIAVAEPAPQATEVLGPFVGFDAPLHPANLTPHPIGYEGTDLGWSYEHGGRIQFLFGDTHVGDKGAPVDPVHDDTFGSIDLAEWPDPTRIARGNVPALRLGQNLGTTQATPIDPGQPMEGLKTPLAGFSNGTREFGIFITGKPLACRADAECGKEFTCDKSVGFIGVPPDKLAGLTLPCSDNAPGCTRDTQLDPAGAPVPETGLCTDRTSSIWADTDFGRVGAYAIRNLIGVRSLTEPGRYTDTREWATNKFTNVATRTVADFVPERGAGRATQDYRNQTGKNRRVFFWGRPGFVGVNAKGSTLGLYFAYVDLPSGPGFSWDVHYYVGTGADGAPRFSRAESEAVALDLDASRDAVQPAEMHDLVQQMSIVWIEPLAKWVMFYGGGISETPIPQLLPTCGVLEVFARGECKNVVVGNGAIRMRTADDPWGPWSPPTDVIVGGDADQRPLADQYAPGGVLHHPACAGERCQPPSVYMLKGDYGWLYGANIIEEWTRPAGKGVDVIWNASTWDPYRVILLRTRINP
jgi:prepilin-type processing-associated H-X9-DG protein